MSLPSARRTTGECAKIVLDRLAASRALSRKRLLETAALSADEVDRALKYLREHGAIRHSALSTNIRAGLLYERTGVLVGGGKAFASDSTRPHGQGRLADGGCFSELLQAWNIRPPVAHCGVRSVVRDNFSQEEKRDQQAMAERRRKFGSGRRKSGADQAWPPS